jgi:hypothetical protein
MLGGGWGVSLHLFWGSEVLGILFEAQLLSATDIALGFLLVFSAIPCSAAVTMQSRGHRKESF